MTLIRVDGDRDADYKQLSDHEFTETSFFHDQKCEARASSMTGRFKKTTTYRSKFPLADIKRAFVGDTDDESIFLSHILEELKEFLEVVGAEVDFNTEYDPQKFERLFKEKSEWADKIEKEYGMRIY